jgi:hypothetical protein
MTSEIRLWKIQYDINDINHERPLSNEVEDSDLKPEKLLEVLIQKDILMISDDLLIIGRQKKADFGGKIDLLCVDRNGDLAIIELKKATTSKEVIAQTLNYASWVNNLTKDEITIIADEYLKKQGNGNDTLETAFKERFDADLPDVLNESHSILIVANEIDEASERIINYLSSNFDVAINAVTFQYFQDEGREYIARVFLIEQDQIVVKNPAKPRVIPPKGNFDIPELKERLIGTLNQKSKLHPKLICFLKLLLSEDRVFRREDIRQEFLKNGISANEHQAAIHLTNVSGFITNPSNSHLQQIIEFRWIGGQMKDEYRIDPKYRELVSSLMNDLKDN